jgi:hypothetical protein
MVRTCGLLFNLRAGFFGTCGIYGYSYFITWCDILVMENWQIIGLMLSVIGWLALQTIQHSRKIAVMEKSGERTDAVLAGIKEQVIEMRREMNGRFDLFLKSEIDILKEFISKK